MVSERVVHQRPTHRVTLPALDRSGLFTQDSLERKGPSRSVTDRPLRLGVPFAIYTLIVWPLNGSGTFRRAMARSSYLAFMLQGPVLVGIAGSFALAWPLVTRTPLRRVL